MRLLALSASAPIAMVLLHVLVYRAGLVRDNPGARLKLLARIALAVSAVWGLMAVVLFAQLPLALALLNTAYVVVVSLSTGYTYFIIFSLSETALRTRLLVERYVAERRGTAGPGPDPTEDYHAGTMLSERIDRLLAMGAAREERGKLLGVRGLIFYFSWAMHTLTRIWRGILFGRRPDSRTFVIWKDI
jgi:hypothetical protein